MRNQYAERAEAFAAKVRDVSEVLVELGPVAPRHPLPLTVVYHDACHLSHAQRVRSQPSQLLGQVPGLTVKEIADGDLCCGSAGIYNLTHPVAARELGDRKAGNVAATEAELLVTSNPGCLLQITDALARRGQYIDTAHLVLVLDASLTARASLPSSAGAARAHAEQQSAPKSRTPAPARVPVPLRARVLVRARATPAAPEAAADTLPWRPQRSCPRSEITLLSAQVVGGAAGRGRGYGVDSRVVAPHPYDADSGWAPGAHRGGRRFANLRISRVMGRAGRRGG